MTLGEMRLITGLPEGTGDAEVVAAYAAMIGDGIPAALTVAEPIDVEQAKAQCRIDDDIEDALIEQKISAAREIVEDITSMVIAQQTFVEHFSAWGECLTIFKGPVISIDAIAYDTSDGPATYTGAVAATGTYPVRIYPAPGAGWPALPRGGGVQVVYTAGYDSGEVPAVMTEAMLVLISGMMDKRSGGYDAALAAANAILHRRRRLGYA